MTESLEKRVERLEQRILVLEESTRSSPPLAPRRAAQSPREFLLEKSPRTDNDRTLAAGYYIEIISGSESFDFDDIESFYHNAKEAAPANRRDPPYQNVKKGYFRQFGKPQVGMSARNRWALTNSGIARVEGGFKKGGDA